MPAEKVYERLSVEEIVADAITVAIHRDETGAVMAWAKWGPWVGDGVHQHGDFEGPLPVRQALERAEELAPLYNFSKVVVYVDAFDLWQAEWGTLVSGPTASGVRAAENQQGPEDEALI